MFHTSEQAFCGYGITRPASLAGLEWFALATSRAGGGDDDAVGRTAHALRLAVGRTARRLRRQAGGGLTPSQAAVLDTVARRGPISPSKIADAEHLTRSAISRIVAKLRTGGLFVITPDPNDRRS